MKTWEDSGLSTSAVRLILVDNAGYCAKAFKDHLQEYFPQATLRTCWAHSANRFGATIWEHKHMAPLRQYVTWMRSLVHGVNQCSRRQRYIAAIGKVLPDFTDTRWTSNLLSAEHHLVFFDKEVEWLQAEEARLQGKPKSKSQDDEPRCGRIHLHVFHFSPSAPNLLFPSVWSC